MLLSPSVSPVCGILEYGHQSEVSSPPFKIQGGGQFWALRTHGWTENIVPNIGWQKYLMLWLINNLNYFKVILKKRVYKLPEPTPDNLKCCPVWKGKMWCDILSREGNEEFPWSKFPVFAQIETFPLEKNTNQSGKATRLPSSPSFLHSRGIQKSLRGRPQLAVIFEVARDRYKIWLILLVLAFLS